MERVSMLRFKSVLFVICFFAVVMLFTFSAFSVNADDTEEVVDNGIPVVYINIDESRGTISDMLDSQDHSVYCYGTISIDVPEGFHYSDFEDIVCESVSDLSMSIRGRGNSSWGPQASKKPYKIKLDKKADIFGLGSNKHWVLLANAFDNSLLRDRITGWLGDKMGFEFTPRGVPVDLVMTGEEYGTHYLGSYYLSENVRVDSERLEIEELDEDDIDPDIITGGYLLQIGTQISKDSPDLFYTSRGVSWATHTPSFDTEENTLRSEPEEGAVSFAGSELEDAYKNKAQQEYIQNYIQEFEDVLFEGGTAYRDLMDVETAAKYWLINIIPKNQDAYGSGSTYLYKDRDKDGQVSKLYWGPVWDFDYAWTYNYNTYGFDCDHVWLKPLLYDKGEGGFVQEIYKQWPSMRSALEELIADGGVIDKYYEETKASAERELELYPERKSEGYLSEVEKLKKWIRDRIDWVDDNIDLLNDMVYKVTFIADDEVVSTAFLTNDDYMSADEVYPEKKGFTFAGWADEEGNIIDDQIHAEKDMTLTAQFIADSEVTHGADIAFGKASDVINYNAFFSTYKINYEVVPIDAYDKKVTWTSSDESIATVDRYGNVRYYQEGTVTFTASLRLGKTRSFTLMITKDTFPYPESISPEEDVIRMTTGGQSALNIVTDPTPAKIFDYEYESENTDVVTVGDRGILTATGTGETVVHVIIETYDENGDLLYLETSVKVIVTEEEPETEPDTEEPSTEETEPTTEEPSTEETESTTEEPPTEETESTTEEPSTEETELTTEEPSTPETESSSVPAETAYTVIAGSADSWIKGSRQGVTFTVKRSVDDDTCFSHFRSVQIDSKTMTSGRDYQARSGSTVITLYADTLQKLSDGKHTITVNFDDGKTEKALTVRSAGNGGNDRSPKTGDNSHMNLWACIAGLSLLLMLTLIISALKKRY